MYESILGISIINLKSCFLWDDSFLSSFRIPMATIGAFCLPTYKFSIAANFIGWYFAILRADPSPVKTTKAVVSNPKTDATTMLLLANRCSLFFNKNQALTPMTKTDARTYPEDIVCRNLLIATGEKSTSQKFTISLRAVSGLNFIPAGYCIQPLATRIHNADKFDPKATIQVESRWNFLLTLFQPKNMTAIKVLSRKKAMIPSIASGAPKMSPTNHE